MSSDDRKRERKCYPTDLRAFEWGSDVTLITPDGQVIPADEPATYYANIPMELKDFARLRHDLKRANGERRYA